MATTFRLRQASTTADHRKVFIFIIVFSFSSSSVQVQVSTSIFIDRNDHLSKKKQPINKVFIIIFAQTLECCFKNKTDGERRAGAQSICIDAISCLHILAHFSMYLKICLNLFGLKHASHPKVGEPLGATILPLVRSVKSLISLPGSP